MRRELDTARPRPQARIVLSVVAAATCLALVTGCTDNGPKPEDQRDWMVDHVGALVDALTERLELVANPEEPNRPHSKQLAPVSGGALLTQRRACDGGAPSGERQPLV